MKPTGIIEKEYDKLIKRLEFFDTMRNNLLTFSFTAVLTVLGVALTVKMDSHSSWICLIPFFLIIPFVARISYYRLASAHICSFLRKYAQEDMKFEIGTSVVSEDKCKGYHLIAWLVNHEMVLLAMATSCTFYLKYTTCVVTWEFQSCLCLVVPIALTIAVYLISNVTYDYKMLIDNFSDDWNRYSEDI